MRKKKIQISEVFISQLHALIYENSNTCIGLEIDKECKKFKKKLEECNWEYNNQ